MVVERWKYFPPVEIFKIQMLANAALADPVLIRRLDQMIFRGVSSLSSSVILWTQE